MSLYHFHTSREDWGSLESYVWIYVRESGLNPGIIYSLV